MAATAVPEWLGDGRYRLTGETRLPIPAGDAQAYLTRPELFRRWAVGGKVSTRFTFEDGH
jgi:hypothetical protein